MRNRVLLVATALCLAGCGGHGGHPASAGNANRAAAVRNAEAAQATAQSEFGLLAGGDYGAAWDLWTGTARQAITRADFIRLNTACRISPGVPVQLVSVRAVDGDTVAVDWRRGTETGSAQLLYADGAWHYQPDPATLAEYQQGVDALLAKRRAAHLCAGQ